VCESFNSFAIQALNISSCRSKGKLLRIKTDQNERGEKAEKQIKFSNSLIHCDANKIRTDTKNGL